ncbi:MAG: NAD(P)/FAD-dependent oxidoreductase [Myxococcota bacterium]
MDADGVVVGGGVVGLAVAAALARRGLTTLVLERAGGTGRGISSRNSEVIHAGLYYPPGSLKAVTCIEGRERLYRRCLDWRIPHRRVGKLIVATEEKDLSHLENLLFRGRENGAGELEILSAAEVKSREPGVEALGALWSPESGVVDAEALVSSYQAEAEAQGAQIVMRTRVVGLEPKGETWTVATESADGERFAVSTPRLVNAAGLGAERVARMAGIDVDRLGWRIHLCKGDYFAVAPAAGRLTEHLVYPVPTPEGLGIHVTCDLGGRTRLGPDVEYVQAARYDVDPAKAERFAAAVARFLPRVRTDLLSPDSAGIRPKLQGPGESFRDFVIEAVESGPAPPVVHLIGIESPGLTAAGSIGERVADLVA